MSKATELIEKFKVEEASATLGILRGGISDIGNAVASIKKTREYKLVGGIKKIVEQISSLATKLRDIHSGLKADEE